MRIIAGILCIVLIAGCSEKDNIPSGILDKEQMGAVLWDMMQADQYAGAYLIKDSAKVNIKMETLKLYEQVFRLHNVTRDQFRKSLQFYQDHPDITHVVLDSLAARGGRLKADSYTHPSTTTPAPTVKPVVPGPGVKPPVVPPARPSGTLPNRPAGTLSNKPPATQPNQQGGVRQPNGFLMGKDSTNRLRRKGIQFLPGQHSPGGVRPFLRKDTTRHISMP
ncbi:MAG TPA: DUF4296 domain-containing protein [Puia sp.]|nr:DUF4296 domain-containing protein [Puia sp.]